MFSYDSLWNQLFLMNIKPCGSKTLSFYKIKYYILSFKLIQHEDEYIDFVIWSNLIYFYKLLNKIGK